MLGSSGKGQQPLGVFAHLHNAIDHVLKSSIAKSLTGDDKYSVLEIAGWT